MRHRKKKPRSRPQIPRARNAHSRQRQRLIDACISALHIYGPSRTTVEKVVAIAKMSPGIVRFYFASKAAMLVASLQFLAAEFEEQLLVPVSRLKTKPVAALELMVDLYLDPEIASPRKVSVWYAFWGEASSRQEYYDICGQKDESFAALVRELIERLILETSQPQLDPDGMALGLIGVLEMLWQDFAFRSEEHTSELQSHRDLVCRLMLEQKKYIDVCDLIGNGNIGLQDAIVNFDPSMGVRFETYCVPCIRGAILASFRAFFF